MAADHGNHLHMTGLRRGRLFGSCVMGLCLLQQRLSHGIWVWRGPPQPPPRHRQRPPFPGLTRQWRTAKAFEAQEGAGLRAICQGVGGSGGTAPRQPEAPRRSANPPTLSAAVSHASGARASARSLRDGPIGPGRSAGIPFGCLCPPRSSQNLTVAEEQPSAPAPWQG